MTLMEEVWEETTATLGDRAGLFALLGLGLFVPPVLHAAWLLATAAPGAVPTSGPASAFGLLTTLAALWTQLAVAAAAGLLIAGTAAARIGVRRLLPALGIEALILLMFGLILVPMIAILARHGVDFRAMSGNNPMAGSASMSAGDATVAIIGTIVFAVAALLIGARLLLVVPVVAIERRGVGAIARSWELTRGFTWRIVGATMLFVIVTGVAVLAAQSVAGVAATLIAGTDSAVPPFVAATAGAAVTAALGVVAIAFTARLWRALDVRRPA